MEPKHTYRIGDRVRLTCPYAGGYIGEEAKIVYIKRDEQGNVLSLDVLFCEENERTRGTTLYPREVELVYERMVGSE